MPDILYYDGQCPLCAKEMAKLTKLKDSSLVLTDIHSLPDDAPGRPDKTTLLRVLHLERNGSFITGIDANVAAWEHTRYGALWRWMKWPIVRWFVGWGYDLWAEWRYRRLYACKPCSTDSSR